MDQRGSRARGASLVCCSGGRVRGREYLFDTFVSIHYLVCIFSGDDYITACIGKHLELEQSEN